MNLFNSNFEYKMKINVIKDNDGKILISTVIINQEIIVLTNYYSLKFDEIHVYIHVLSKNWYDMSMIWGGDWNLVLENIYEKEVPHVVT